MTFFVRLEDFVNVFNDLPQLVKQHSLRRAPTAVGDISRWWVEFIISFRIERNFD